MADSETEYAIVWPHGDIAKTKSGLPLSGAERSIQFLEDQLTVLTSDLAAAGLPKEYQPKLQQRWVKKSYGAWRDANRDEEDELD